MSDTWTVGPTDVVASEDMEWMEAQLTAGWRHQEVYEMAATCWGHARANRVWAAVAESRRRDAASAAEAESSTGFVSPVQPSSTGTPAVVQEGPHMDMVSAVFRSVSNAMEMSSSVAAAGSEAAGDFACGPARQHTWPDRVLKNRMERSLDASIAEDGRGEPRPYGSLITAQAGAFAEAGSAASDFAASRHIEMAQATRPHAPLMHSRQ